MKEIISDSYTESDYDVLEEYLSAAEQPIKTYEPVSRIAQNSNYIMLRKKYGV